MVEQQQQQLLERQGRDPSQQQQQQQPWVDDIFSFAAEGEYVYSWLTGCSARAAERAVPPGDVTHALISLLRTTTQDPSWRNSSESETEGQENPSVGCADCRETGQAAGMQPPPPPLLPLRQARSAAARPPAELVRSDWNSNPLFRGSYSYIATGSSPADMEELARPLSVPVTRAGGAGVVVNGSVDANEGTDAGRGEAGGAEDASVQFGVDSPVSSIRVIFAGEAMHPQFFSTAHGGFETGRRAAREVLASCGFNGAASTADVDSAT